MAAASSIIEGRLKHLETHLEQENPVLLNVVQSFRRLDSVAYGMGLLNANESFSMQIPWWPLISVLGTFSAGKSTFINDYLGINLQRSGNQAVDDKFTVICYSDEQTPHALPGVALDSDPRFPFYKISGEIDKVAQGEGARIDSYLQLKSCPSERLKGKILIDSPGFDADAQRTSTLRITDHIIDLSDLVLVFFDARHPEPGAMRDTLDHLVSNTIKRSDSGKFLYILNQIDTTAKEDNPEEVVAAWQRALGERGLTAGRFFSIYNEKVAVPIEDGALRTRYETKCKHDLREIHGRMQQIEIERAYRIVGSLEKTARDIQDEVVPMLLKTISRWKHRVLSMDAAAFVIAVTLFLTITIKQGHWDGFKLTAEWWQWVIADALHGYSFAFGLFLAALTVHYGIRHLAAKSLSGWLKKTSEELEVRGNLVNAFLMNTRPWRSIFSLKPVGWGKRTRQKLSRTLEDSDNYVQELNDRFTNPSGGQRTQPVAVAPDVRKPDNPPAQLKQPLPSASSIKNRS